MSSKIGILGGTFNPVHNGHLVIAQAALEQLNLSRVIFVPTHTTPNKDKADGVDASTRLRMVQLAAAGNGLFEVSEYEMSHNRTSYSYLTVQHFKEQFSSGTAFYFIVGEDTFQLLGGWKNIDQLKELVIFAVAKRPGVKEKRAADPGLRVCSIRSVALDISSSLIRAKIGRGESVRYLLPEAVFSFINASQLYAKPKKG